MTRVLLGLACLLVGVSSAAGDQPKSAKEIIEERLHSLIARDKGKDAFVIFTDEKTRAFIQFTYEEKALWIDIPLVDRSDPERKRMERLFASIGVLRPQTLTARDPETKKAFIIQAYQASFGVDVRSAATFGMRVFREAFEVRSPSLSIQTE